MIAKVLAGAAVAGLTLLLSGCGSASRHAGVSTNPPATAVHIASGSALSFREVLGTMPYGTNALSSCQGGRLVTAPAKQTPSAQIVLADRKKSACYLLGPTLLTGIHVGSADAGFNPSSSLWEVDVHFTNDDFVKKVASVEVNKQIAIIVDGVVELASVVNPAITGNDVAISAGYDEATARNVAARIDPSSRSRTPETPTTIAIDTLIKRCQDVAPRLGFGMSTGSGSTSPTADMIRSGFERARQPVPPELAHVDGNQQMALCYFTTGDLRMNTSPTTVCPNGDRADVGPAPPLVTYVVDADLYAFRFPGMQYLLPTGMPEPSAPNPCSGLGAP